MKNLAWYICVYFIERCSFHIQVQGRRGWAPKSMIMEQKIMIKAANLIQIEDETTKLSSGNISGSIYYKMSLHYRFGMKFAFH